jgi:hypothetical protein
MLTRLSIVALTISLAACGSSIARSTNGGSPRHASAACGPAAARTLASSSSARAYVSGGSIYGCSVRGRTSYRLGANTGGNPFVNVGQVVVSGDLAAYTLIRRGVDTGSTSVIVRRLSDGKQLRNLPSSTTALPEAYQSIRSLALKPNGAVAWIVLVRSVIGRGSAIEVRKADAGRPAKLLDSGSTIAPTTLRLRGSRLTWKHGETTRSATLH